VKVAYTEQLSLIMLRRIVIMMTLIHIYDDDGDTNSYGGKCQQFQSQLTLFGEKLENFPFLRFDPLRFVLT